MWQVIITGIILAAALAFAILKLVKWFNDPLRKCRNCSKECGGCPLEELKKNPPN